MEEEGNNANDGGSASTDQERSLGAIIITNTVSLSDAKEEDIEILFDSSTSANPGTKPEITNSLEIAADVELTEKSSGETKILAVVNETVAVIVEDETAVNIGDQETQAKSTDEPIIPVNKTMEGETVNTEIEEGTAEQGATGEMDVKHSIVELEPDPVTGDFGVDDFSPTVISVVSLSSLKETQDEEMCDKRDLTKTDKVELKHVDGEKEEKSEISSSKRKQEDDMSNSVTKRAKNHNGDRVEVIEINDNNGSESDDANSNASGPGRMHVECYKQKRVLLNEVEYLRTKVERMMQRQMLLEDFALVEFGAKFRTFFYAREKLLKMGQQRKFVNPSHALAPGSSYLITVLKEINEKVGDNNEELFLTEDELKLIEENVRKPPPTPSSQDDKTDETVGQSLQTAESTPTAPQFFKAQSQSDFKVSTAGPKFASKEEATLLANPLFGSWRKDNNTNVAAKVGSSQTLGLPSLIFGCSATTNQSGVQTKSLSHANSTQNTTKNGASTSPKKSLPNLSPTKSFTSGTGPILKKLPCRICNVSMNRDNLKWHMRAHIGVKIPCSVCDCKYTTAKGVQGCLKRHGKPEIPEFQLKPFLQKPDGNLKRSNWFEVDRMVAEVEHKCKTLPWKEAVNCVIQPNNISSSAATPGNLQQRGKQGAFKEQQRNQQLIQLEGIQRRQMMQQQSDQRFSNSAARQDQHTFQHQQIQNPTNFSLRDQQLMQQESLQIQKMIHQQNINENRRLVSQHLPYQPPSLLSQLPQASQHPLFSNTSSIPVRSSTGPLLRSPRRSQQFSASGSSQRNLESMFSSSGAAARNPSPVFSADCVSRNLIPVTAISSTNERPGYFTANYTSSRTSDDNRGPFPINRGRKKGRNRAPGSVSSWSWPNNGQNRQQNMNFAEDASESELTGAGFYRQQGLR